MPQSVSIYHVWVSYSGTISGFFLDGSGSHLLVPVLVWPLSFVMPVENKLEI
jgi:hypothetical protein